ncbi:MAG: IS1380 family transposase, partial [Bacteroidales bacterium]|nr:IS1380 family transposase [Bacteroidales bacterium]
MAKIAIKSKKITPFGGIFPIMEQFSSLLSSTIDSTLGLRCKLYGYQYSEIIRSLLCVYFCGGSCVEDVTTHLAGHLSLHPTLRICSADTILRAIKELTQDNISYTSDTGKTYDFNTADKLNTLLHNCLLSTGQLKEGEGYDVDFDHQFIEAEKFDAKPTYKKFLGYRPGVAVIGDMIVGIENSDGNTNVRFHQADTHKRFFALLESQNIRVNRFRADCGSCSKEIV